MSTPTDPLPSSPPEPSQPSRPAPSSSPSDKPQDPSTDPPRRPHRPRPEGFPESQASKMWKAFENPAGGPVNELPGGKYNTAGGRPREYTWRDAFRTEAWKSQPGSPWFFQTGCARDSLLVGMGAGGAVGGLRFILKGLSMMYVTTSWAVGSFAVTACGMKYWCDVRRREESKGIAAAVAGMKMLQEKRAREESEEKARKAAEEAERGRRLEEERKKRSWWKPW